MTITEQIKTGLGRRTRIAIAVGALLALGGGAYFYYAQTTAGKDATAAAEGGAGGPGKRRGPGGPGGPGGPNRAQPIKASEARIGDLDVTVRALGTVTASNTAVVKPRVDGQLIKINFHEGQVVKAGDVLAEIDPRPFQIQVDQAHGQLLKDQAQLSAAQVDLERYRGLLAKDSIAKQQVDSQDALVRQYRGAVETDKAQEANARLNLDFTRIKAPASGRLGLRQVDIGNMVRSSDTNGIVVITQTQPIHVVFAIPSESLGNIVGRLQNGDKLVVEAWNRDGSTKLGEGRLVSVDNQIDVATGTVKLKAEFENKDNNLFPNQFVNARLKVETRQAAVLLPSAAVQRNNQGTYVYIVKKEDQTVEPRPVTVGPVGGELTVIEKGLAAGEQVVLDGADKLRPGSKVDVMSIDGQAVAGGGNGPGDGAPTGDQPRRHRAAGNDAAPVAPVATSPAPTPQSANAPAAPQTSPADQPRRPRGAGGEGKPDGKRAAGAEAAPTASAPGANAIAQNAPAASSPAPAGNGGEQGWKMDRNLDPAAAAERRERWRKKHEAEGGGAGQ